MANPFINPNDPNLQTQNPDLSQVLLPPAPAPSFAAHMANPANIAAIAPSVAPRSVVTPSNVTPKPNSIFNAASNWFAPSAPAPAASSPNVPGMVSQGNIDVNHRPIHWGPSGNPSTIYSSTIPTDKSGNPWSGDYEKAPQYALVPTLADGKFLLPGDTGDPKKGQNPQQFYSPNGKQASLEDAAAQRYAQTHENLGMFSSADAADRYAESTHAWMPDGSGKQVFTPSYSGHGNMPLNRSAYEQKLSANAALNWPSVAGGNTPMTPKSAAMAPPAPSNLSGMASMAPSPLAALPPSPMASAPAPAVNTAGMGAAPLPSVTPAVSPMVQSGLQSKTQADQQKLTDLQNQGAGLNKINNGFLRGLARAGDIAGSILAPGVAAQVPGTTLHNRVLQNRQQGIVAQDQNSQQIANQQNQQRLQNQDTQSQIGLRNAQAANLPELAQLKQAALDQKYAAIGQKPLLDSEGNATGQYVPDEQSPIYQKQKAQNDYFTARAEYEGAAKDYAKARTDAANANPDTPAGRQSIIKLQQAQQRLGIAQQVANTSAGRLGLSGQEFAFNQDKFYNPQPTAAERGKGDLAQSAVERVAEMKAIVKRHPEYFGPGEGRATRAQEWLGSQDPDAQTYLSAGQYLSDHSAGVFGGRGKYITEQLHNLTDPKMNPAALNAALDEAERAAQGFVKAGAVHGKGGGLNAPMPGGPKSPPKVGTIEDGHRYKGGNPADPNSWEMVKK